MNKRLAAMVGKSAADVHKVLSTLEHKAGYPSQDVRYLARHTQEVRIAIRELGLDPDDTTAEELYHCLLAKFKRDALHIDKAVGISEGSTKDERIQRAVDLANYAAAKSEAWAIKSATCRSILKAVAPKRTMKQLGYRSLDSMLKRQAVADVLLIANQLESPTWRRAVNAKLSKLSSASYELKPLGITRLTLRSEEIVLSSTIAGAVAVNEQAVPGDIPVLSIILPLEEHVQGLSIQHKSQPLSLISPALTWWLKTEHLLAWQEGLPISFNLRDVSLNHLNGHAAAQAQAAGAQTSLWHKLVESYKDHIEELPEDVLAMEQEVATEFKKQVMPAAELAQEFVEA